MKNIMVSLDFDDKEERLVSKALEFGKAFKAKIWLVHIAAPEPDFVGYDIGPQYIRDCRAEELRDEHRSLQKFADNLKNEGVDADGILVQGATLKMIKKETKKLEIDMIIAGYNKRNFLYDTFVGSVSKGIIQAATLPVLLVPLSL
jgi:nucleotide-binding universal stress UspA family protein